MANKPKRQVIIECNIRAPLVLFGLGFAMLGIGTMFVLLSVFGTLIEEAQTAFLIIGIVVSVIGLVAAALGSVVTKNRIHQALRIAFDETLQAVQEVDSPKDIDLEDTVRTPI